MYELKNKKSGRIVEVISDEEYELIKDNKRMSRFTVTELKLKTLIPSLKTEPKVVPIEIKKSKTKKE